MGIENRPYIGTWQMGTRKVVQQTPDALVYVNGDVAVPGCAKCNSRIDIQKFVTQISVDGGCDAAAASANITLSVPVHHLDALARDGQFILHPGLEVHVYERGYFPVKGMYSNLAGSANAEGPAQKEIVSTGEAIVSGSPDDNPHGGHLQDALGPDAKPSENTDEYKAQLDAVWDSEKAAMEAAYSQARIYYLALKASEKTGVPLEYLVANLIQESGSKPKGRNQQTEHGNDTIHGTTAYGSTQIMAPYFPGKKEANSNIWWDHSDLGDPKLAIWTMAYDYQRPLKAGKGQITDLEAAEWWTGKGRGEERARVIGEVRGRLGFYKKKAKSDYPGDDYPPGLEPKNPEVTAESAAALKIQKSWDDRTEASWSSSYLENMGLSDLELESLLAYPYYQTFHGVVTQVSSSWSAGTQTFTLNCASMLHFWQYHQVSTNASIFGVRPENSKARSSLIGHNFTGMHPYEIIYTLHNDTAGAAGGIAWALDSKTNQTARSPVTGESLFGLNIRYWQQRFNQREIKLRLHGASGQLFNTAQAAFLSRTKSAEITSLTRQRFRLEGKHPLDVGIAASSAAMAGMTSDLQAEALLYTTRMQEGDANSTVPKFELNVAEMIAFVSNIQEWGQVQLFESTYESKMDIAQKVCEVTGFEFYQDVDGDFVFKPPMYNLDTSTSRVYRLEDIDIISINFDEKEPEVTYMTIKGSGMTNQLGVGLDNEWGKRGQYIDYRLVAQYGWRPGNYESQYYNDSRSMYYAAMNRLDVKNASCKSASITIPLRPEIRPGYPVYIPYLDCFYYCNSFNHSFSVGGQCTTTLQMIAKRAKFFAPGDPTMVAQGINAINLAYPAFPSLPLQVEGPDGRPYLQGFPNAVLALDPMQLNPVYFMVGSDIDLLDSEESIQGLLKMAVDMNVLTTEDKGDPGPEYTMSADGVQVIKFWFPKTGAGEMPEGAWDVMSLAAQYSAQQEKFVSNQGKLREDQVKKAKQIAEKESKIRGLRNDPDGKHDADIAKLITELNVVPGGLYAEQDALAVQFEQAKTDFDAKLLDVSSVGGVAFFRQLIVQTGERFFKSGTFGSTYGDPNATTTLLDMLSDKKATLSNSNLPGSYRYYSASHPAKEQQGQPVLKIDRSKSKLKEGSTTTITPFIDSRFSDLLVQTFTKVPSSGTASGAALVGMEERKPIWGIRVLTNRVPGGEYVPTSEIREMMFAVHEIKLSKATVDSKKKISVDLGVGFQKGLSQMCLEACTGGQASNWSIQERLSGINVAVTEALGAALAAATPVFIDSPGTIPPISESVLIPEVLDFQGGAVDTGKAFTEFKLADQPNGTVEMFPGSERFTSAQVWPDLAAAVASDLARQIAGIKNDWWTTFLKTSPKYTVAKACLTAFSNQIASGFGTPEPVKVDMPVSTITSRTEPVYSPVFPVSDKNGYEVVGSYRYGRDVDIDPDGVFDTLARLDILSMLDRKLVGEAMDVIVWGKGVWIETTKQGQGGKPVTEKTFVSGATAVKAVEQRLLASLRSQLTDQQILDIGAAKATGNPNVLEFNLRNWFIEKAKDGVHRIPLVNAGYSLADLQVHTDRNICTCRMADADVLLEVAGQEAFLQFTPPGMEMPGALGTKGLDPMTQWMMTASMAQTPAWRQSQEALRGALPDQKPSSLVKSLTSLDDAYQAWARQTETTAAALKNQAQISWAATTTPED